MTDTPRHSRTWWAFTGFLAIAAFFLLTEHRAHLFGILPFLFLLACPFLHLFGHGGHGGHDPRDLEPSDEPQRHSGHNEPARPAVDRTRDFR